MVVRCSCPSIRQEHRRGLVGGAFTPFSGGKKVDQADGGDGLQGDQNG